MTANVRTAVLAAFAADSLALGLHWIYNTRVIDRKYGRVEDLLEPKLAKFHAGKPRGAFTHYGDQMLVLLETVAGRTGFDPALFAANWSALMTDYDGYVDGATKATLEGLAAGKPMQQAASASTDLGGAARMAPLLLVHHDHLDDLVAAARTQTALTHNHPQTLATAELFARAASKGLQGTAPVAALEAALEETTDGALLREAVESGLDTCGLDTRQAISDLGQACALEVALPSTVHLIASYENDLKEALVANINAGGDSAGRGMLTGMLLGACHGPEALPETWLQGMRAYGRITELMAA